jgi:EAL domain-containing protein (putative c-di-GMP-specific phosphodiesterase class I)
MRHALARTRKPALSGTASHVRSTFGAGCGRSHSVSHAPPALSFSVEEIVEGLGAGEFESYFQPMVHMRTLRVVGAAALARWNRPRTGIVRPHGFVPALEEAGESEALARFMLVRASAFLNEWRHAGDPGTIAVNVSLRSLANSALVGDLVDEVHAGRLDARGLIIDVTSPVPADSSHSAVEHLAVLHACGFAVSIDSYGHGYLSMQQLVDVPFSQLRIAPALMECARRYESARAILASSIEAAHSAHIEVIAEKMENAEDWDLMADLGCDVAQGNYVAEPMTGSDFLDWLRSQQGARAATR